MSLIKTSLLNGIAVGVRVGGALLINKILAVYVGPAGYAVIGQFQNVVSVASSLAGGVLAMGVTKSTAQHFDDECKQHLVWQTAIRLSLSVSLLAAAILVLITLDGSLAQSILHRTDMSDVFIWLALTLPALAANNLLLAIVNGKKEVASYVAANIIGSLVSLVLTGALAFGFGLYGALVAFVINPAIALLATAAIVARREWFKAKFLWGGINRSALHELSGFALMGITSALTVPVSYMLIRDHLATNVGLSSAGYWQASWRISETYLLLVTTTLSVYYLPRLAEIRTASELKKEVVKVYRFVMPITVAGAATIYLMRDRIIGLLFTAEFSPMRELFLWQLIGDVIKIGSWILGYVLVGRALVRFFVMTEIAFSILLVLLSWLLVDVFGLLGVSMAYALNYFLHLVCMAYLAMNELRRMEAFDGQS